MATLATTLDVNSNPVIFSIGSGGTVSADRQVPTNDAATPYRPNGLETLAGIKATSIAAYQAADGSPAVLATTGATTYIYANEYQATGNAAQPYAWTGWQPISSFVAKSIVAVSSTNGSGPAIFAIGADSNVYEDLYVGPAATGIFTDFQILSGLRGASLAATYDGGGGFRVFGLTGPESYVYQDTTINTEDTISSSGWSSLGNFVANSISVATGPDLAVSGASSPDTRLVFATGAGDGLLYDDSLVLNSQTGVRTGSGFEIISPQPYEPNGYPEPGPVLPFIASTATDSGGYLTLFALTSDGSVYENQYVLTGLTSPASYWVGWQDFHDLAGYPLLGTEIASASGVGGGVEVITTNSDSNVEYSVAPAHDALSFPGYAPIANAFSYATTVSSTGYHQIVTTMGVTGRAVVFTIGSDGSVYETQDQAAGTGVTTTPDPYSTLTQLPGIAATSIAATTEPDGIALFALTGASSVVFEDQYRPTGSGNSAYAWTGWQQVGTFVASSIAAATGGDSESNGPTVFAVGSGGNVYSAGSTAPASPSGGYTFADFSPLSGLSAAMISAVATATGIEVAATLSSQSYAYADLETTGSWSGWQLTGNYVVSTVLATTSSAGGPAVAGISPLGYEGYDTYGTSGWGTYQAIAFDSEISYVPENGSAYNGFASVTLPGDAGVAYLILVTPVSPNDFVSGVYSAYTFGDGTSTSGISQETDQPGNSLATAPNQLQPAYYLVGTDGVLYVNQAVPSGDPTNPYTYLGYVSLGRLPS